MPELPEVETVRRGLEPYTTGARIEAVTLNRADLRFPFPDEFAAALTGAKIVMAGPNFDAPTLQRLIVE